MGRRDGPSLTAPLLFRFIFLVLLRLLRGLPPVIVLSLLRLIAAGVVFPLAVAALLSGLTLAGLVLLRLLAPLRLLAGLALPLTALLLLRLTLPSNSRV